MTFFAKRSNAGRRIRTAEGTKPAGPKPAPVGRCGIPAIFSPIKNQIKHQSAAFVIAAANAGLFVLFTARIIKNLSFWQFPACFQYKQILLGKSQPLLMHIPIYIFGYFSAIYIFQPRKLYKEVVSKQVLGLACKNRSIALYVVLRIRVSCVKVKTKSR